MSTEIEIRKGDISAVEADVIVNAANNHLWMGAGVAGALKRAGGQQIEDEAVRKGPIPVGEAVETKAGNLKAKYVIHAAVMGQDLKTDEIKIRNATRNSLKLAVQLKAQSIAFPALGTGIGGFPLHRCAEVMLKEVLGYSGFLKVVFVLYSDESYTIFERAYKEMTAQ
jgi:O-acetyl-ADP-ribose deacetylase (regulator of RNase III)